MTNALKLQTVLFLLSDDTLRAIIKDAEKLMHDAPITAEETRYIVQQELDANRTRY